jgi:hypothetical protein
VPFRCGEPTLRRGSLAVDRVVPARIRTAAAAAPVIAARGAAHPAALLAARARDGLGSAGARGAFGAVVERVVVAASGVAVGLSARRRNRAPSGAAGAARGAAAGRATAAGGARPARAPRAAAARAAGAARRRRPGVVAGATRVLARPATAGAATRAAARAAGRSAAARILARVTARRPRVAAGRAFVAVRDASQALGAAHRDRRKGDP